MLTKSLKMPDTTKTEFFVLILYQSDKIFFKKMVPCLFK